MQIPVVSIMVQVFFIVARVAHRINIRSHHHIHSIPVMPSIVLAVEITRQWAVDRVDLNIATVITQISINLRQHRQVLERRQRQQLHHRHQQKPSARSQIWMIFNRKRTSSTWILTHSMRTLLTVVLSSRGVLPPRQAQHPTIRAASRACMTRSMSYCPKSNSTMN